MYMYMYISRIGIQRLHRIVSPFFLPGLATFLRGADRSPFFRIIYPSKIIRLIIEKLVSRFEKRGRVWEKGMIEPKGMNNA